MSTYFKKIIGKAPYGSYPWQVIILTENDQYVGAGALIDHFNIITVADKVLPYRYFAITIINHLKNI